MKTLLPILFTILVSSSVAQNPYTQYADMLSERWGHSMCVLDGKIYAIGGSGSDELWGAAFATMEVYDPTQDNWTSKASMLHGRANFGICTYNSKIYAIGGGQSFFWDPQSTIEEYDPVTDTWTYTTDMPRPRMMYTTSLIDDKIYIKGGFDNNHEIFAEVDVYDIQSDTWSTKADLPTPRHSSASAVLNGKIYIIGGVIVFDQNAVTIVEAYDLASDTWTTKEKLIKSKKMMPASVLNGKIYIFGGGVSMWPTPLSSVEEYDPVTDIWQARTDMPLELASASAVSYDGKIYVSGGATSPYPSYTVINSMHTYDPLLDPLGIFVSHEMALSQISPNPFTTSTTIKYELKQPEKVSLMIYNHLGQLVHKTQENQPQGKQQIIWNAEGLPDGIYYFRLQVGEQFANGKMVKVR